MKTVKRNKLSLNFYIIIILNLLSIGMLLAVCIKGYFIAYPKLTFNALGTATYLGLIIIFLLPTILSMVQLANSHKNKSTPKRSSHFWLIGVFLILSILSGFILLSVPPVESYTSDIKNYLLVDKDLDAYTPHLRRFFPEKIPSDAQNITYSYKKYSDVFKTEANISIAWQLSKEAYMSVQQELLQQAELKEIEPHKYEVVLTGIGQSKNLKLLIEYSATDSSVIYTAIIQPH